MDLDMIPQALVSRRALMGGEQIVVRFPNQYGASVVRHMGSYGGCSGLWELAVVRFNSDDPYDFALNCKTPITDDVLGWLTESDVVTHLEAIAALSPGGST